MDFYQEPQISTSWNSHLPIAVAAMEAGAPFELRIASHATAVFSAILVGALTFGVQGSVTEAQPLVASGRL
jgi:hypothetical protein